MTTLGRKRIFITAKAVMPVEKPKEETAYILDSLTKSGVDENKRRLERYRQMYDALSTFRAKRARAVAYNFGRQWEDLIADPDNHGRQMITEREYIMRQGKVPLKNNVIRKLTKAVLGLYRQSKKEPMVIARDKDESELGDMMSAALQYAQQNTECKELNTRLLEETMLGGMPVSYVDFRYNYARQCYDVYCENINPNCVFFNQDVTDVRFENLRVFGVLSDLPIEEIVAKFATSPEHADAIRQMYANVANEYAAADTRALSSQRFRTKDFFVPADANLCRVIEAWELETRQRIRCHDTLKGEEYVIDIADKDKIEAINAERLKEYEAEGLTAEDTPTIKMRWFIDRFWYVRYLTPMGDVLYEARTPFAHGECPYTIRAYPMVDGEIHSFVEDIIDQQRYINRYITMMDFIRGASAKGVLIFPEEAKPSNMTEEEICDAWVKYNGVIFAKMKPGIPMPQQISTSAVQAGDVEMLNLQLRLLEEISGVHSAMQGATATSGTPAALYAQQAQNASNNLTDLLDWFEGFIRERDFKMMSVLQQYYTQPRYSAIVGHDYDESVKMYTPERVRNIKFDIAISETTATPAYRLVMNDILMQMLQSGAIDVEQFLESSKLPFADRLLQSIRSRQEQMQQMAAQEQGNAMDASAMPIDQQEVANTLEASRAASDPKAMSLIDKAFQG